MVYYTRERVASIVRDRMNEPHTVCFWNLLSTMSAKWPQQKVFVSSFPNDSHIRMVIRETIDLTTAPESQESRDPTQKSHTPFRVVRLHLIKQSLRCRLATTMPARLKDKPDQCTLGPGEKFIWIFFNNRNSSYDWELSVLDVSFVED